MTDCTVRGIRNQRSSRFVSKILSGIQEIQLMVKWVGVAERFMWMKLQNVLCQLTTGGSHRAVVANTSLASSSLCLVLLRKLHIQALGFYMIMLGLSFSLLQVNVSLSNQLAKGFMQDGCFAILGQWDDPSITLEFVICKRRQFWHKSFAVVSQLASLINLSVISQSF